jgi:hypothetical protein
LKPIFLTNTTCQTQKKKKQTLHFYELKSSSSPILFKPRD